MLVIRDYYHIPESLRHTTLAIGNFDGVHLGHQAVIEEARGLAQQHQQALTLMTFHPHPRRYFDPQHAPLAIDPLHIRLRRLRATGVDGILLLPFNAALASISAHDFISDILVKHLAVGHVVVGEDFRFGRARGGTIQLLQEQAIRHRFGFTYVPPVMLNGYPVSSSRIRQLISTGDMTGAATLLGRPYQLYGRVIHGNKRGRELGIPTANIRLRDLHLPRFGVYAVQYALVESPDCGKHPPEWKEGVANLGIRPTFGGDSMAGLEVHAFEPLQEIYGTYMRVRLIKHLRDERHFTGSEELKTQIMQDCMQAKAALAANNGSGSDNG